MMGGYQDFLICAISFDCWIITPEFTAHGTSPRDAFAALVKKMFGEPSDPVQLFFRGW